MKRDLLIPSLVLFGAAGAWFLLRKKKQPPQEPLAEPPPAPPYHKPEPTLQDKAALSKLGYVQSPTWIYDFQGDFNAVKDMQTAGAWTGAGLAINVDGQVGSQTRGALTTALDMQNRFGQWLTIVKKARQEA